MLTRVFGFALLSAVAAYVSPWLALLLIPLYLQKRWSTLPAPLLWAGVWTPYLVTAGFAHAGYAWAVWIMSTIGGPLNLAVFLMVSALLFLAALADIGGRFTLDWSRRATTPGLDLAVAGRRSWGYRFETVSGRSAWRVRRGGAHG